MLKIDSRDQSGRSNSRALRLLVVSGADVAARDPMGATVLHLGVLSPASVQFALGQGISANATDSLRRTPTHYLLMLSKRSLHERTRFRTVMLHTIMISWYAGEIVVEYLKKSGVRNLQDAKGLKPKDYLEVPLATQFELTDTARWIGDNEERYRLRREVIQYYLSDYNKMEYSQSGVDSIFCREPSWRIVPDEVSASPSELD